MERFSLKIEIINHFDNLIDRIDIDIDSSLEKFNDKQLLSEIIRSSQINRLCFAQISHNNITVEFFDDTDTSNQNQNSRPESMKIVTES